MTQQFWLLLLLAGSLSRVQTQWAWLTAGRKVQLSASYGSSRKSSQLLDQLPSMMRTREAMAKLGGGEARDWQRSVREVPSRELGRAAELSKSPRNAKGLQNSRAARRGQTQEQALMSFSGKRPTCMSNLSFLSDQSSIWVLTFITVY